MGRGAWCFPGKLCKQQFSWKHMMPQKADAFVWKAACHADEHCALTSVISERKEMSEIIIHPQSQLWLKKIFACCCCCLIWWHWIHWRCLHPHEVWIISHHTGRLPECQVICTVWTDCIIICWLSWKESWQWSVIRFSRAGKCRGEDTDSWGPYHCNFK